MADAIKEPSAESPSNNRATSTILKRKLEMPEVLNVKHKLKEEEQPNVIFNQWMQQTPRKLKRQISRVDKTPDGKRICRQKFDKVKHLQELVNRVYSSKYSKIRISPGVLKVNDGQVSKNLYYLQQYHPENKRQSKEAFGHVLFFEAESIEDLQNLLQKLSEHNKTIKNKVIVDEWDIDSEQSKFRKELADEVSKKIAEIFLDAVAENCPGCQEDQPNQLAHEFCLISRDEKFKVLFPHLLDKIELNPDVCKERLLSDEQFVELTKRKFDMICEEEF